MKTTCFKSMSMLIFSSIVLWLGAASCNSNPEAPVITLIHTNDTHSQIDPAIRENMTMGGAVERAAIIELMRDSFPELLYLDGGDMVQGSPYFNLWKGKVEMECMNAMGLRASTFGNHEFDNGILYLDSMLTVASFPILSCNYNCTGTALENHVKPSMIIENQGVRIGLTGVTCSPYNLISNRNWEGIEYLDPVESANKEAAKLKEQGCDIVILLSHEGYDKRDDYGDRKIATHSSDIDLIIGGHTHTNLEEGDQVQNQNGRTVYITQTGGKQSNMGRVDLQMKREGKRADGSDAYILTGVRISKINPGNLNLENRGEKVRQLIAPYTAQLEATMQTVIGHTDVELWKGRPESPLGNFTTDAMLVFGERVYGKKMDVAIMNVGGLRNEIAEGDVTVGDLFKVYPFENALAILELKGSYLEEMVHKVEFKKLEAFAGLTCDLVKNADGKPRATNIRVNGQPIDRNKVYHVVTIDYLAEGNDSMTPFLNAEKVTKPGITIRDAMIDYVKELTAAGKTIESKVEGRVIEK